MTGIELIKRAISVALDTDHDWLVQAATNVAVKEARALYRLATLTVEARERLYPNGNPS